MESTIMTESSKKTVTSVLSFYQQNVYIIGHGLYNTTSWEAHVVWFSYGWQLIRCHW